ncbi:MAG TPA: toll/interleukin-1 receptor domain-containing protein, partial [Saprospiraceae bacterium]|nr:toll/interleukin-1 receptor domain-containing protein [Saprospiraceae bacterium]
MQEEIEQPKPPSNPAPNEPEVFISYAWGGESEQIVNELQRALQARHLTIVRDKQNLGYKGSIREFMQRIGKGRYVIVVISDKYLKSENCMFELLEIAEHGDFYRRIFPVVLNDANIYRPVNLLAYVKHWKNEKDELNQALKEVDAEYL